MSARIIEKPSADAYLIAAAIIVAAGRVPDDNAARDAYLHKTREQLDALAGSLRGFNVGAVRQSR